MVQIGKRLNYLAHHDNHVEITFFKENKSI